MRLVDIDKARDEYRNLIDLTMSDTTLLQTLYGVLDNAPTVEAIPKADYENRLKADMVAMLEELKDKMLHGHSFDTSSSKDFQHGMDYARREDLMVIQEKIDSLKEK